MSELSTASDNPSTVKHVAHEGRQAAAQAAVEVKDTAAQQAQRVGAEASTQARNVAAEVRNKVSEQARTQNDKLVGTIRQTADHLDEMRADRADSPAAAVVSRVADGGRQLADYLDRHGPEGVLREVQDFARRRPGAFLATALAAGFVVGRLGKSVAKAEPSAATPSGNGGSDPFLPDYRPAGPTPAPASTSYAVPADAPATGTAYATTGTGIPAVVNDPYDFETPERRP